MNNAMKRSLMASMEAWKQSASRKPMLLQGARQVGKTYLLEQFGSAHFPVFHRFDFAEEPALRGIFDADLRPERIVRDLGLARDIDIDIEQDLLILDEIQRCPKALASLKYFAEKMPQAFVCGSGSLLGLGLTEDLFPVGKVERLHLYPMTFREFLLGMGCQRLEEARSSTTLQAPLPEVVHNRLWEYYKYYLITGGLPEVVATFLQHFDRLSEAFAQTRRLQANLIQDYTNDIAKHSGKMKAVRVESVFRSVPIQLARETAGVHKFVFRGVLKTGSRLATLEGPIAWLQKAGLVHKVMISSRAELPFDATANERRFKLYLFDVGLLGAMLELAPKTIFGYDYGHYKGYFAENAVLTELVARWHRSPHCWQSGTSEIEFLMDVDGEVIPVEVKAGINTKAKSLSVFRAKYSPRRSLLLTAAPPAAMTQGCVHLPLYLADRFPEVAANNTLA
jgi:predicted AAA+ superfamily ATPase